LRRGIVFGTLAPRFEGPKWTAKFQTGIIGKGKILRGGRRGLMSQKKLIEEAGTLRKSVRGEMGAGKRERFEVLSFSLKIVRKYIHEKECHLSQRTKGGEGRAGTRKDVDAEGERRYQKVDWTPEGQKRGKSGLCSVLQAFKERVKGRKTKPKGNKESAREKAIRPVS